MDEVSNVIDFFGNPNSEAAVCSPLEPKPNIARKYLDKYWLSKDEYFSKWMPIQNQIFFNQDKSLPQLCFQASCKIFILRGGLLFSQEDFEKLQCCMKSLGNKEFVIIQNTLERKFSHWFPLRMKYPVDISWAELMGGDFISSALFDVPHYEYFVFSETQAWGKYSDNEKCNLDIVGYLPEHQAVFKQYFEYSKEEEDEIKSWRYFPKEYANVEVRKGCDVK
jgi:hypothetical protein